MIMRNRQWRLVKNKGFTVVELIVVIVVIAILATVTVLIYDGAQKQAAEASIKSDLQNASAQLESDRRSANGYPKTAAEANGGRGLSKSDGTTFVYRYDAVDQYCLVATSSDTSVPTYRITNITGSKVELGNCDGLVKVPTAPGVSMYFDGRYKAFIDPWVGLIVSWEQPDNTGGAPILQYRVRAVFGGSCASYGTYTYTLAALAEGTSGTGGSSYERTGDSYQFVSGLDVSSCHIVDWNQVTKIYVSARNSAGWGPEREYPTEWTM